MQYKRLSAVCLRLQALVFLSIIFAFTKVDDRSARSFASLQVNTPQQVKTDVYARMEAVISNTADYGDDRVWYFYRDVSIRIKFYTDMACTQPYTLTSPLDYKIEQTGSYETLNGSGSYPVVFLEGTVPSGESEFTVADIVFDEEETWWDVLGNVTYLSRSVYDYQLLEAGDSYIVSPDVYPTHPF